jgi:arsenite-transporting ATPase
VRTILFTGKGGVGKTTLSAATALHSASLGYRTLVISTDIAHSLADVLGVPLANEPHQVGPSNLYAAELDTGEELEHYWGDIKRRIAAVLRDQGMDATAAGELAVLPGLDEVLALVRIKRYHDEGHYDVLIIDSAPTGAAMRLLSAPDIHRWYTRHLLGLSQGLARAILPSLRKMVSLPISEKVIRERLQALFGQIKELRDLLTDRERTSVRLVLNPDHMSLQETQRAFTYMSLYGFSVDSFYVNRVLPEELQDPFFTHWKESQAAHRDRIREVFSPLPVFEVPLMRREVVGLDELNKLARQLYAGSDPVEPLSNENPLRFYTEDGSYLLAVHVTGVTSGSVELEKRGDELLVKIGRFRRSLVLPQYLATLQPVWAKIEGHDLKVAFEEPSRKEQEPSDS